MNKLLYLSDDEVQSQLATKFNLLVHIGRETFQYAIIDTVRDQLKVLAEFEMPAASSTRDLITAIQDLPESSKEFKLTFNKVKISFDTSSYTFIPADLYLEEHRQEYGKYLKMTGTNELLVTNILSAAIKNVVSIESELNTSLNRIFQKPKIYNQAGPFLEGILKTINSGNGRVCFIDIQANHFQAAFLKDFKLEFYNSFEYANADEFNYYLLSIIESLDIQTEQIQIVLSGKISENDEIYNRIQKYFDSIRFTDTKSLVKYPEKFEEILPHTYFSLISLDLCE